MLLSKLMVSNYAEISLKWFLILPNVDLINSAVGTNADREKRMALEKLHGVIGVKNKKGAWTKFYETLMKRHIELCVDLKDHITAKDGLHQYRNLCLQVNHYTQIYLH